MPIRFREDRLERAWRVLSSWADADPGIAVAASAGSSTEILPPRFFGQQAPVSGGPKLRDDAIFLIASPTKPIMSLAVMQLLEAGEVSLGDPVCRYVPQLNGEAHRTITLAHCLTHSSGLPDMPLENRELRAKGASHGEWLERACASELAFLPGRGVAYQSMGFLLLAEVVHQVAGKRIGEWLTESVLQPLGMQDTVLGMPPSWEEPSPRGAKTARIVNIRTPEGDAHAGVWNTTYWRRFGAPWGGLLSTPADLARLCQHLLNIHRGESGVITPASLEVMTTNQLERMPHVPEMSRRAQPWALGWRLNWPHGDSTFGDLLSPSAYGHWGATGTMVWIDPARDLFLVVLTTQPLDANRGKFAQLSNAVVAAAV